MRSEEPLFLSPEEVSWVLSVSPQAVRYWVRTGKLRVAPRIGRQYRIYFDQVLEYAGLPRDTVLEIVKNGHRAKQASAEAEVPTNKPQVLTGATV